MVKSPYYVVKGGHFTKRQILVGRPNLKKLQRFEDKIDIAEMAEFDFRRIGNIVGKRENADYQHFLLLRQCC